MFTCMTYQFCLPNPLMPGEKDNTENISILKVVKCLCLEKGISDVHSNCL